MGVLKKMINNGCVIASCVATFITGIATSILNALFYGDWFFYVVFGLFLLSVSTIFIQILISTHDIKDFIKNTENNKSGLLGPEHTATAQNELEELINDHHSKIKKIIIICYGTSGYGDVINKFIKGTYENANKNVKNIQLDVMLCSPDAVFLGSARDKSKIEAQAREINNNKRIELFYSKFLPTIRCCAVYDNRDKPIWNCIQNYGYTSESHTSSAVYADSFALVGRENNPRLLEINNNCIKKEFERLKERVSS